MAKEIALVERTKRLLHRRGAMAVKTHGSALSQGEPDLVGCFPWNGHGVFFAVEMKVPGEKPRPLQYARLRQWRAAGAVAFWSDDPSLVVPSIEAELRRRDGEDFAESGRVASWFDLEP